MKYIPVIGLEVHIQFKTKSKMFCSCPADYFGKKPNTQTCPTCLGLPGALPTINKKAIDQCIKLALSLSCKINRFTKFDRKNYFYPDLPKGYQITQYDLPIGYDGFLEIDVEGDARRIRIIRVHQEEDTGKSIHKGRYTLLDYNKSGVPLAEIVTAPEFTDIKEITEFAKELQRIVRYTGVSDADMEKGQMRFELNISLKKTSDRGIPDYKVEVKNIGSISVLEKVINSEIKRQSRILNEGKKPVQETRGLKDMSGKTVSQRTKEGSSDYRYFPEPDLPPIQISDEWIQYISKEIPELPRVKRSRFIKEYNLEHDTAKIIASSEKSADWFEKAVKGETKDLSREVGNWFIGDFLKLKKKKKMQFEDLKMLPKHLVELVNLHKSSEISGTVAKKVLEKSFKTGKSPNDLVEGEGLKQVSDEGELQKVVMEVIKNNPKPVKDYKDGKENAIKFLVGQVMRQTKGKANPKVAEKLLKDNLR